MEIPKHELGKDLLWNSQIAKTTAGAGYGGGELSNRVVRWELKGNRVLMLGVDYSLTANPNEPIALAVKNANNDAIIQAFPVAAFAKDGAPVIEVSRLFTGDLQEFSARTRIGATGVDASRTFIEHINAFPENLETEVTVTYTRTAGGGAATGGGRGGGGLGGGTMRGNSATVVLHHSMVRLPEKPMMPRLFDERVGYFTTSTMDYSRSERVPRPSAHATSRAGAWRRRTPLPPSASPRNRLSTTSTPRRRRSGCPGSRRELKTGTRLSPPPASRTPSSARKPPRLSRIRPGAPKTCATPSSAGYPLPPKTPAARTSATRARARFSMRTSSSITT